MQNIVNTFKIELSMTSLFYVIWSYTLVQIAPKKIWAYFKVTFSQFWEQQHSKKMT